MFFASLFPISTFDILPTDEWFEYIFDLSEIDDEPKSLQFELVGYESGMVYNNMGSLLIYMFL